MNTSGTDDITELLGRKEPLREELAPWLETLDNGWRVLRHPLVYAVPYVEEMNALHNRQYDVKTEGVAIALKRDDWDQAIWYHERPYRVTQLVAYAPRMQHGSYWSLVRSVWIDTESPSNAIALWRKLLRAKRPGRRTAWTADDRAFFAKVPRLPTGFIVAYRGTGNAERTPGWSWTTDHAKASWFARRLRGLAEVPRVMTAQVRPEDVLFALADRGESELVIDPRRLRAVRTLTEAPT